MKDATHHLKHIQKKVIQSSRKAAALEELNHEVQPAISSRAPVSPSLKTSSHHNNSKKKAIHTRMRKSLMRLYAH